MGKVPVKVCPLVLKTIAHSFWKGWPATLVAILFGDLTFWQ